jgi:8-oxo-dGTP pyrophosphatase MutT (NUDIX family)
MNSTHEDTTTDMTQDPNVTPEHLVNLMKDYSSKVLPYFDALITAEEKEKEEKILVKFEELLSAHNSFSFERNCFPAHITGSSIVLNPDLTKVVLTHHKKLDKWLQLGGHADGDHIPARVSLKEASEESGISESLLNLVDPISLDPKGVMTALPIDFDIHLIPQRKDEPEHCHYDVRFLLIAKTEDLSISDESNDLKWFSLNEIKEITNEVSTLRQIEKVKYIIKMAKTHD